MANQSRRGFLKIALIGLGSLLIANENLYAQSYLERFFRKRTKTSLDVTPNDDFYIQSYNGTPAIDVNSWKLEVGGSVENPIALSYADIMNLPSYEEHITLICIGNDIGGNAIGNALWHGVNLKTIMDMVKVKKGAKKMVLYAGDGYEDSVTLDIVKRPFNMLAYKMNGVALPKAHGYPLRLLVPGIYGMKNAKWLKKIEFVDYNFKGYWEKKGWSDEAVIRTMSRIDMPNSGDVISGTYPIEGIAFAGVRGIQRVEVSTDGGKTWHDAILKKPLSNYSWTLWRYEWKPATNGKYKIVVRATDGDGKIQADREEDSYPEGASGPHSITVRVNKVAT